MTVKNEFETHLFDSAFIALLYRNILSRNILKLHIIQDRHNVCFSSQCKTVFNHGRTVNALSYHRLLTIIIRVMLVSSPAPKTGVVNLFIPTAHFCISVRNKIF